MSESKVLQKLHEIREEHYQKTKDMKLKEYLEYEKKETEEIRKKLKTGKKAKLLKGRAVV